MSRLLMRVGVLVQEDPGVEVTVGARPRGNVGTGWNRYWLVMPGTPSCRRDLVGVVGDAVSGGALTGRPPAVLAAAKASWRERGVLRVAELGGHPRRRLARSCSFWQGAALLGETER